MRVRRPQRTMSANYELMFMVTTACASAGCEATNEDLFSGTCPAGVLPDGGCNEVPDGRATTPPPDASSTRDAARPRETGPIPEAAPGRDAAMPETGTHCNTPAPAPNGGCRVTGGGVSLSPPGSCTVLAYCSFGEFRLVCRDGAPTCDCRTRGVTLRTIPNTGNFCAVLDCNRTNIDAANAACGWNLDTSTFNQ